MDKWEYMTMFVEADIDNENAKEYLSHNFPKWKNPSRYAPQIMIPELNSWGEAGWEVIHMEPVYVGKNEDIGFPTGTGIIYWSHVYFCVMKRKRE